MSRQRPNTTPLNRRAKPPPKHKKNTHCAVCRARFMVEVHTLSVSGGSSGSLAMNMAKRSANFSPVKCGAFRAWFVFVGVMGWRYTPGRHAYAPLTYNHTNPYAPLGESAASPPMSPWTLNMDSPCRVK